jgi:hypothetical protein
VQRPTTSERPSAYRRIGLWVSGVLIVALVSAVSTILLPKVARENSASREARSYEAQIRQSLFALLQPVKLTNCTIERFGEPNDGGYLMCANLLGPVQAGYSYGIAGYDQWGCDASRKLEIRVHEYDCFDLREPSCPGGELRFHAECVGTAAEVIDGRQFDTLVSQIARNGDDGKRLVVKVDVEGAEWNSFLLTPDSVFERIDQLVVEFHGVQDYRFLETVQTLRRFFHVAHVHFNNYSCDPNLAPFPAAAYEVLFVNKRIGVVDGSRGEWGPHAFDAPNKRDAPDCQVSGE